MPRRASHVFLLSPARSDGERARILLNPNATFSLAVRLREVEGVELGEVFSFLSGLYFRGKLTYARAFARPPRPSRRAQRAGAAAGPPPDGRWRGVPPVLIITADRGLLTPDARVRREDLLSFAEVDISAGNARYQAPLRRDAESLAALFPGTTRIVLLGSIATGKYVDVFLEVFGERLVFPVEFVGRGDMSRGGLLLRHARSGEELEYVPVAGAVRRGRRPAKLERLPRARTAGAGA